MNENLSKAELNELNLDDEFTDADVDVDKKRDKKTRRRLRHKKSKLSIDDVTGDERQRRKSTPRRQDAKTDKKPRRPNIVLIMTDDQVTISNSL